MRTHRFYIENINKLYPGDTYVTQETDFIHQLKNVFRFKIGQKVTVFNQNIGEMEVELISINKKDMSFICIRQIKECGISKNVKRHVSLYMSIIKNSNFDLVVEKAVELGVQKIVPIITERTVKNDLNITRLNRIIKEAAEQSGRMDLMTIDKVLLFKDSISKSKSENDTVYFGSIDFDGYTKNTNTQDNNIAVFIGPEGGFSEYETSVFTSNDIKPIGLGSYVLRAETAAIVACGILSL